MDPETSKMKFGRGLGAVILTSGTVCLVPALNQLVKRKLIPVRTLGMMPEGPVRHLMRCACVFSRNGLEESQ